MRSLVILCISLSLVACAEKSQSSEKQTGQVTTPQTAQAGEPKAPLNRDCKGDCEGDCKGDCPHSHDRGHGHAREASGGCPHSHGHSHGHGHAHGAGGGCPHSHGHAHGHKAKDVTVGAQGSLVTVPKEGKEFKPPIAPSQLPDGVWYCDMGTVEYARAEQGDGRCPICRMRLKQKTVK